MIKYSQKKLTLIYRAYAHTATGKVISYIQDHPEKNEDFVLKLLTARCLPFCLQSDPTTEKQSRSVALGYAVYLESMARSIREYWSLAAPNMTFIPTDELKQSSLLVTPSQIDKVPEIRESDDDNDLMTPGEKDNYLKRRQMFG